MKLVAAVLALVAAALLVISSLTTYFLRQYLIGQVDDQLRGGAVGVAQALEQTPNGGQIVVGIPSDYVASEATPSWVRPPVRYAGLSMDELPRFPADYAGYQAQVGEPFTVRSADGRTRWRMLYSDLGDGRILAFGQHLTAVDQAVKQLIWIDLLVGGAVLIIVAAVGAGIVRTSLKPLVEIERTAAAIAGGDLTRRVPDPEEGRPVPTSELGRLSRALNAMLAQIEAAFTARAASEAAARSAEVSARDAAVAAQASEARARR
ncbi:HAMP domain-containing protein, partial [Micromonospora sp. SL1-18]|uniref:HAMP domain-containing protein n=1 Tax=Micromonospora sp. SL1-18 TaxID=3399128 RepID=UPI003A4D368F